MRNELGRNSLQYHELKNNLNSKFAHVCAHSVPVLSDIEGVASPLTGDKIKCIWFLLIKLEIRKNHVNKHHSPIS